MVAIIGQMTEAVSTSEMAVSFYQTNTWREVIVILDVIT
jgi:hypothetical protein